MYSNGQGNLGTPRHVRQVSRGLAKFSGTYSIGRTGVPQADKRHSETVIGRTAAIITRKEYRSAFATFTTAYLNSGVSWQTAHDSENYTLENRYSMSFSRTISKLRILCAGPEYSTAPPCLSAGQISDPASKSDSGIFGTIPERRTTIISDVLHI